MDILHVCPSRSFSGLEQYAFEIAKDQKSKGHDVGFVVCPGSTLEAECKKSNIETVEFLYDSILGRIKFWNKIIGVFQSEKNLKVIHLHMTDEVAHMSVPILWQKLRGRWKKHPKIIFQAHIWINHKKKDPYHKILYSTVDEVWCSSEPARKALIESLPIEASKIKIINYGRDIKRFESEVLSREEARKFLSIRDQSRVIGSVSRIEEAKGIRELVEAAVPLLEGDSNLEFVVIGGVSPNNPGAQIYYDNLMTDIKKLPKNISERIVFKGALPNSHRYLKAFDIYVLPSYLECFSLSLLDAQLANLPVIGSKSGGTPEIVLNGKTGWLFEPRSVKDLRDKLNQSISQSSVWDKYGATAQVRVKSEFDQNIIFDKIIKFYGEENRGH